MSNAHHKNVDWMKRNQTGKEDGCEISGNMEVRKERLWNAQYCKAMVGNFMLFFSFYILTPLLPIYLDAEFAADKDMMGLVLSGYVVAALIVRPFSGFIVDTFDRKKVLAICFFFFFIVFILWRVGGQRRSCYIAQADHKISIPLPPGYQDYSLSHTRSSIRSSDCGKLYSCYRLIAVFKKK